MSFDPHTGSAVLRSDEGGVLAGTFDWLQHSLRDALGDILRARARRAKLRAPTRPWRQRDFSDHERENMIPMFDIAPGEQDLVVVVDGQRYWVEDLDCVEPHCTCMDVVCDIHGLGSSARGVVRIDLAKQRR